MKRTLTLLSAAGVLALGASAQMVLMHDTLGNQLTSGQHIIHIGAADAYDLKHSVYLTLNGGSNRVVNVRRYELNVQPGTMNYFCWGVCYGPQGAGDMPVWNSMANHTLLLQPDVQVRDFGAYHMPQGLVGSSTYRYVWFDVAAPTTDSVWLDIEFRSLAMGMAEQRVAPVLSVYPNPSNGEEVRLELDTKGEQGLLISIYSLVGERLRTERPRGNGPVSELRLNGLAAGVYFAVVERNGRALSTQRVVVRN